MHCEIFEAVYSKKCAFEIFGVTKQNYFTPKNVQCENFGIFYSEKCAMWNFRNNLCEVFVVP